MQGPTERGHATACKMGGMCDDDTQERGGRGVHHVASQDDTQRACPR